MPVCELYVEEMTQGEISVDGMATDKMSVDEMTVDKMSCYHLSFVSQKRVKLFMAF
jgi:hypothetical protein